MSEEKKSDGWLNVLTGLGRRKIDKSQSVEVAQARLLTDREMAQLYAGDGIGARVVDCVAEDAARNGFTIDDDDAEESLLKLVNKLKVPRTLQTAHVFQRAFAGALIVAEFERDNDSLDKPVSASAVVRGFKVYGAPRVNLGASVFATDPRSPFFEDVEVYNVSKRYGGSFDVHASRCRAIKGVAVPDVPEMSYNNEQLYWGMSAVQRPFNALGNLGAFVQGIGHLGQEMVIGKYRIANLEKLLLANDVKAVQTRMELINMSKSVLKAVLLGKDEEYTRDSLTFAGVPDVFDRLAQVVSGATGIPLTKLFGRSAAGMNASGEGDSRDYYDKVKAEQTNVLQEPLEWMVSLVGRSVRGGNGTSRSITFNPVWTPSQKEELEMRERQQKIDAGYIADQVYSSVECRESRFKGGYSFETKFEDPEDMDPEDKAAYEAQLAAASETSKEPKANG